MQYKIFKNKIGNYVNSIIGATCKLNCIGAHASHGYSPSPSANKNKCSELNKLDQCIDSFFVQKR